MGHTGLARLCLVRRYYRTRTNFAEDGKPPFLQAGEDVTYEYIINIITFPTEAVGDRSNFPTFDTSYLEMQTRYLFPKLWQYNSYLYFFVFIAMFSFVIASFAVFVVSVTMFPMIKYKILAFLPAYLVFTMLSSIGRISGIKMNYIYYLTAFDSGDKIDTLYLIISAILILISVVITNWRIKREI